jgi:hypothetical protein
MVGSEVPVDEGIKGAGDSVGAGSLVGESGGRIAAVEVVVSRI